VFGLGTYSITASRWLGAEAMPWRPSWTPRCRRLRPLCTSRRSA